jgi:hypothetical protein
MSLAIAFWVLMLVWLVLGLFGDRFGWGPWGGTLLLFILLLLLGWAQFGAPLHG